MQSVAEVESQAKQEIEAAGSTAELRELEIKYLGKSGLVTGLTRLIGTLPNEEKPAFGQAINQAKARVQELLDARTAGLKSGERSAQFEAERIDITMPGRPLRVGGEHVLQQAMNKIKKVLGGLGFQYEEYLNELMAIAVSKPSDYYKMRSDTLKELKQVVVKTVYDTYYGLLTTGQINGKHH